MDFALQQKDELERKYDDVQKRYELVNKVKEELVEKLKTKVSTSSYTPAVTPSLQPSGPDKDAYWADIFKAKTDLEMQIGTVRSELKSLQIANEQLQRDKSVLELDLNSLRRDKEDLRRQLDYNQKLMDSIAQELVREKNDKMRIQDASRSIKDESLLLTRQLKSLNNRKVILERKVYELQEENTSLDRRLNEMQAMLNEKLSRISELSDNLDGLRNSITEGKAASEILQKKDSVELPPIVVRPTAQKDEGQRPQESSLIPEGKVLALNRDNNFVIIDLGEDLGIKPGDRFQVYRDEALIATLEVIKTRKNISACDIKKEKTPIRVGDIVR